MKSKASATASVLMDWIQERCAKGTSSEELRVLPEVIKATAELVRALDQNPALVEESTVKSIALEEVFENILKINGGQHSDNFLKDVVQTLMNPKPEIIPKVSILEVGQDDSFTCTAIKQGKEFCASGRGPTALMLIHL